MAKSERSCGEYQPFRIIEKESFDDQGFLFCYCILQPSLDPEIREFVLSLFLGCYILGFLLDIIIFDDKPLKY